MLIEKEYSDKGKTLNCFKNDFIVSVLFTKQGFKIYPEMDKERFIQFCRLNSGLVGTMYFNIGAEDKINKEKALQNKKEGV